ncbi:hypothetical protein DFH27DRAFT_656491 [Peziza echinospora]|nr:hypothetical protein DFH27DRAFT_656491 [Peziza echinospora]
MVNNGIPGSVTHPPIQMLIVPGDGPVKYEKNPSVFIFDTVNWETKKTFDPLNKELLVPTAIVDLVGGTTKGGATLHTPYGNGTFDDTALSEIFTLPNPKSGKKSKKFKSKSLIGSLLPPVEIVIQSMNMDGATSVSENQYITTQSLSN